MTRNHWQAIRYTCLALLFLGYLWARRAIAQPVQYNPESSPIPTAQMQEAIRYALWSWTSRLDIDAEYIGLTGETETDGIVIRWADIPALTEKGGTLLLAQVDRWPGTDKGVIRLNKNLIFTSVWTCLDFVNAHAPGEVWDCFGDRFVYSGGKVSACLIEMITHELGHLLVSWDHSKHQGDVMYHNRDDCRASPSLSDLQLSGKPIKSCHVELTPDGNLESLDYLGKRYSLKPSGPNQWSLGSVYANPHPMGCSGLKIENGVILADVKGFLSGSGVYRVRNTNGNFERF